MKRFVTILAFAAIAAMNVQAQSIESPVCYAIEGNHEATLKYKFLYQDENYSIAIRLIKESMNIFKTGDKITFLTADGTQLTYTIPESEAAGSSEYYTFPVDYADLVHFQTGIEMITSERAGKTLELALTPYCSSTTRSGTKDIAKKAFDLELLKAQNAYRILKQREQDAASDSIAAARLAHAQAKAKIIEEEKALDVIMPDVSFYHRVFVGYTPTQLSDDRGYAEGFTFGYTGGVCLVKKSVVYLEFGVQGDYYRATKTFHAFAISVPIAITKRFELGHSGATLSPFIGPMVRFNVRESGSDIFQIGGQGGINLDYKHLNIGVAYHLEVWTNGNGHTRGLAIRLGYTF